MSESKLDNWKEKKLEAKVANIGFEHETMQVQIKLCYHCNNGSALNVAGIQFYTTLFKWTCATHEVSGVGFAC